MVASWQIQHIVVDIKTLLQNFNSWTIQHIYREANQAANWVTNVGHILQDQLSFQNCTHSTLEAIIVKDQVGAPSYKGFPILFFLTL